MSTNVTVRDVFEVLHTAGVGISINGVHSTKKYPVQIEREKNEIVVQLLKGVNAPQNIREAQLEVLLDILSSNKYDVEQVGVALHIKGSK